MYNLHPIFVHFPIAFFLLYSFLRLFRWPRKFPFVDWQLPRIVILAAGLLGAWVATSTGEADSHAFAGKAAVLELHEVFANTSIYIYWILLGVELLPWFKPEWLKKNKSAVLAWLNPVILFVQKTLSQTWIIVLLALLGALSIFLTGLLGGVMVYGLSADPLAAPILRILGV